MSLRTQLDYFGFCLFFSRIESNAVVVVVVAVAVAVAGGERAFLLRSFDMKKIQK